MQDWTRLAHYVRSRRVELGFTTQARFADALGVVERTVNGFERGESKMRAGTLAKLESVLLWQPGSASRVLAGGEPQLIDTDSQQDDAVAKLLTSITLVRRELGEDAARALIRGLLAQPLPSKEEGSSRQSGNSASG
jgi:transcriptional regulator with XRE-family HTH domain